LTILAIFGYVTFFSGWLGNPLRDRVRRSGDSGGAQCRAAAPPHREVSAEVAQTSVPDASWFAAPGPVGRRWVDEWSLH